MTFFDLARRNISRHWLRSVLAVIGIVIGVMAIASMGILGNSISLMVGDVITDVGDTLVVTPAVASGGGGFFGSSGGGTFTARQVDEIARAAGNNRVIPIATTFDRVTVGGSQRGATIYAIHAEDIPVLLERESGTYPKETAAGCMIGSQIAENGLKLGSRIDIGGDTLRVVGVLEERGMGFDINPDYAVVVPYRWYSDHYGEDDYDQVIVKVRNVADIDSVKEAIEGRMNRRETVVNVMDTRRILESIFAMYDSVTIFLMGIGAISLLVAGVSILNVMMMSVTERIKEIGVLRSIGTRRNEVMRMFIYEALILGLAGAAIGGVLSFLTGYAMTTLFLGEASFLFNPTSLLYILFGMAFGITTSVASGFYPAWKASQLNPIQALRHE
jgi:putative ABC transport system permease protein